MIPLDASVIAQDSAPALIAVALITAVASVITTWLTVGQNKKVGETHKQVTVNHHSSEEPTVLDLVDDVKQLVLVQGQMLNVHIAHSNEMDLRLMEVESEVRRSR